MSNESLDFSGLDFEEVKSYEVPLWDFDTNPILIGKLTKIVDTQSGYKSRMYHLQVADGSIHAIWSSYNIARAFEEKAVAIGSIVKIQYEGEKELPATETADAKTIKIFKVAVPKAA